MAFHLTEHKLAYYYFAWELLKNSFTIYDLPPLLPLMMLLLLLILPLACVHMHVPLCPGIYATLLITKTALKLR